MADRSLLTAYLERLDASLPMTDAERVAALEEIAGHVADATAELVERGLPADLAERRALSRLGAPERLADELAAAHRTPRDLLVAAGVALRSTVRAVVWSVLVTWILVFVISVALGLAWALVSRLMTLPHIDWTRWINAPLVGITMALAAFAVGRTVVRPVALAAHRPEREVRVAVLAAGLPIAALAGLVWIDLQWNLLGAALAALLPAWFATGVMRPNLLPAWFPLDRPRIGWSLIAVIVISLAGMSLIGAPAQQGGAASREIDPTTEFIAIAPFKHFETAPLEELASAAFVPVVGEGTGPIAWSPAWRLTRANALAGWTDVRAEVWAADRDTFDGPLVGADVTGPIASAPLRVDQRRASATLSVPAVPMHEFYYLAVVGTDPHGERQLASWPGFRQWTWVGTPLEFLIAMAG